MAKFYGTVEGDRGLATRCGTSASGIKATAQSFDGSVIVYLNDIDDKLVLRVEVNNDSKPYGDMVFEGSIEEFVKKLEA